METMMLNIFSWEGRSVTSHVKWLRIIVIELEETDSEFKSWLFTYKS